MNTYKFKSPEASAFQQAPARLKNLGMRKILFVLIGAAMITLGSCSKNGSDKSANDDAVKTEETSTGTEASEVPAEIAALSEKIKGNTEEILPTITQEEFATMLDFMLSEAKTYYSLPEDEMATYTMTPRGKVWGDFQIYTALADGVYLDEANKQKYDEYVKYAEAGAAEVLSSPEE